MFAMKVVGLVMGIVLLLSVYRSASVPWDAQVKGLDQRVEGSAPGPTARCKCFAWKAFGDH